MRKTLFALLGLVAIGMWAVPALAGVANNDPPKAHAPIPLEDRAGAISSVVKGGGYQATLSGTLIKQASATTSWFLYPGACTERNANTWVPRTTIQADSLDTYPIGTRGDYTAADLSLAEKLFHVADSGIDGAGEFPAIITGTRMIWCGKFDPNWVVQVGYPNITNQILYIDLENDRTAIAADPTSKYSITMKMNASVEQGYDYVYFMGGGDSDATPANSADEDPLTNDRGKFDVVRSAGVFGPSQLFATFTGSVTPTTDGMPLVDRPFGRHRHRGP
jgi:hypothetical protein